MFEDDHPSGQLENLTPKQIEVLDLLIMHRTTKEIARELSIAPNTVDQRINAVRDKWGTTNRKDTARRYAQLLEQCGKTTCGFSRVDPLDEHGEGRERDLPVDPFFVLSDTLATRRHQDWHENTDSRPVGLEALDARFGRAGRVGAVFLLALVMALILVSSLAIAEVLGRLI
ncbi:LuxR C-terminal-related transcriptional regulator [Novosphingobium album (ex Hu et al. 2023)]|uniref:Helix-turn-helix transcriptional regulator n=1 Tax=Novosphingobium album (ex Hu et al. 2023) TaxID=2930093 RepID=A0ABT0AZA5_9SPHN|nr:helix-turn-helix transcriptional regulator [Novosphingobium album (ex Hu et al. 2023)]MCJ2178120.1 helix-turn-helix transcriptional regulator [Novosphingobium album (ex Hu et al. 2023)]